MRANTSLSLAMLCAAGLLAARALAAPAPVPPPSAPPASATPPAKPAAPAAPKPAPASAVPAFDPPGSLHAVDGHGITDPTLYAPGMRFPIGEAKAFANSQVYGPGGDHGPKGGWQCDAANYAYPWRDTFCEARPGNRRNRLCPNGVGHQGQDIRPNSCVKARYVAVAAADGRITQVGPFWVMLRAEDGRVFSYLHMDQLRVKKGDAVVRGQPLGLVSNNFGTDRKTGKPVATTIHLHFEISEPIVQKDGAVVLQKGATLAFVPPYTSLVDGYQRLQSGKP